MSGHELGPCKRPVAFFILDDGTNINAELVRDGLAWHDLKYSSDAEAAGDGRRCQE